MILLSATNLTKAYGVDTILADVSFHISQGDRVGIVGSNGAGKTTLLNMLSGTLPFDSGDFFMSANLQVGYLRQMDNFNADKTVYDEMKSIFQELIDMEDRMLHLSEEISRRSEAGEHVEKLLLEYDRLSEAFSRKNGYGYKSEISGILNSMAFPESYFNKKIGLLSGGERTRLALASLLLKKPELLLLDEPTNHLDIGTLKWLEQYLKSYSGTIVLISHDRYFLDQTINRVFEIENHRLTSYDGNYTTYVDKKKAKEENELKQYELQQKEIARQEEIIRRFKQHNTEHLTKRALSREKQLEHVERLDKPVTKKSKMRLQFKENFQSGNDVLMAEDLSMSFGRGSEHRQLFSGASFDIKRKERICIVGPNGIGKTTLLKIILDRLTPDSGHLKVGHNVAFGYYDQEQQVLNYNNTVLNELSDTYRLYSDTELRSLLGRFLFTNDDVFKSVSALSGGERARLSLLKLMLSGANMLIMDEPTNHLDIASKEVFEDALLDFPGTMLLVSHDRYLLNKVPTRILELNQDGITAYLGGYDYYVEKKQSISSGKNYLDQLGKAGTTTSTGAADNSSGQDFAPKRIESDTTLTDKEKRMEQRRQSKEAETAQRRREKELARLEALIEELEEKTEKLTHDMCREEIFSDVDRSKAVSEELNLTKEALQNAYDDWMELQE